MTDDELVAQLKIAAIRMEESGNAEMWLRDFTAIQKAISRITQLQAEVVYLLRELARFREIY